MREGICDQVIECKPVKLAEGGWSEWQHPKMSGYRMQCCNCGMVHEVEFRVTRVVARKRWGWKVIEAAGKDFEIEMRMRRVTRE